jgi:hypothetical protein
MSERASKVGGGETVNCRGPVVLNYVAETDSGVGTKSDTTVETERDDEIDAVQRSPMLDSYAPGGDEEEKFDQWSKEIDSAPTAMGSEQVSHTGAEMLESPERAEKMNTER